LAIVVLIKRPFNQAKIVVDGTLLTGQNPFSAGAIGQAILKSLNSRIAMEQIKD
jgi:putative intracellular protease/amidase